MKALSVKQPMASQIAFGFKVAEYRSWPINYRGPICIVASKSDDYKGDLPRGVAICIVDIVECEESEEYKSEREEGDTSSLYVWSLANPRHVEQVPITGFASIYNIDEPKEVSVPKGGVPPRCTYEVEVDGEEAERFADFAQAEQRAMAMAKPGYDAMLSEVDDEDGFVQPLHEYEY